MEKKKLSCYFSHFPCAQCATLSAFLASHWFLSTFLTASCKYLKPFPFSWCMDALYCKCSCSSCAESYLCCVLAVDKMSFLSYLTKISVQLLIFGNSDCSTHWTHQKYKQLRCSSWNVPIQKANVIFAACLKCQHIPILGNRTVPYLDAPILTCNDTHHNKKHKASSLSVFQ